MTLGAQPGQVVAGRYRLVESLGSGGSGQVWRARDEAGQVDVAVKELRLPPARSAAEHAEQLARAAGQARDAARLRGQPNIVSVYEVVVEAERPWIVMELVDGCSLEELLGQYGPLPVDRAVHVARALLTALDAAHRAGVVHRDVKPANVMIASDWTVRLTDFGVARQQQDAAMTAAGLFVGTPEYTAPERVRGQDGLPAGDLFSAGVTLFEAVEGRSPFRRASSMASLTAVLMDEAPKPVRVGRPLDLLISRLLAKDPAHRPSLKDALAMLARPVGAGRPQAYGRRPGFAPAAAAAATNAGPARSPVAALDELRRAARRKSRLRVTLAAAGVVAVVAAGVSVPLYLQAQDSGPWRSADTKACGSVRGRLEAFDNDHPTAGVFHDFEETEAVKGLSADLTSAARRAHNADLVTVLDRAASYLKGGVMRASDHTAWRAAKDAIADTCKGHA